MIGPKKKKNNHEVEQAVILVNNMNQEEIDEVWESEIVKKKRKELNLDAE
jgi:hypothetical protein